MVEKNLFQRGSTWWLKAKAGGKEYRESLHTSDLREARRFRDVRLKAIRAAVYHGERRMTWGEAVVAWHAHESTQMAPTTAKRYLMSIKQCEPDLQSLRVDEVDGKALRKLVRRRQESGATPSTIRRDLTAVSRVLTFAEANDWREGNPTLDVRRLLRERRSPITLPAEDSVVAVLDLCSTEFRALVVAARLTGCRQNELVTAKWSQFNEGAGTLAVVGKGDKLRMVKLSDDAVAHFVGLPRRADLIFVRAAATGPNDKTAWLPFSQAASDFTHVRREAEKRAKRDGRGFVRWRYHDLRHEFAVRALRDGMSIYRLSKHLGHSSVLTTEIYLTHLTPEEAERAKAS